MSLLGSVWMLGLLLAMGSARGQAGSTLPAAQPTAPATAVSAPAVAETGKQDAAKRARVTWMGGQLTIAAENSSINQILREVSRVTGMKVTGGVADERVYGSYGPGTPEEVLERLLMGTGTNLQMKESAENAPLELVLSPRKGGATPPGPAAYASDNDNREDDLPPQRIVPSSRSRSDLGRPVFTDPPAAAPGNAGGVPSPAPAMGTDATAAAPATAGTTEVQSPNGVKTPQQIYDQLMKLQQQKAAQTAPPQ